MTRRLTLVAIPLAVALCVLSGVPTDARAGDRRLEILVVNMTPEPTEAARQCFAQVRRRIAEDYSTVRRMGETPLRRLVGRPEGEWMDLPAPSFRPVVEREEAHLDSVALVDCRPEERRVDLLITSPAGGVARMRLRGVPVDRRRARWVGETILRHAWIGFSP